MPEQRVVITGIGPVCPTGIGIEEFRSAAFKGQKGAKETFQDRRKNTNIRFSTDRGRLEEERTRLYKLHKGCNVRPKSLDSLKSSFVASHLALSDSGLINDSRTKLQEHNRISTSVFYSVPPEFENIEKYFSDINSSVSRHLAEDVGSYVSTELSRIFGAEGISRAINACCSSTLNCIDDAIRYLKDGSSEIALCGSADMSYTSMTEGFSDFGILASNNDEYSPMDESNKGLRIGDGAGSLVLETLDHAKARNATDKIYAEILASASFSDASDRTKPSGLGLERSIDSVLKKAGLKPNQISFVQVHGSGNKVSDEIEIATLKKIFKEHFKKLLITSNKSRYGHSMINAGFYNLAELALSLKNSKPTPTVGVTKPRDADLNLANLTTKASDQYQYGVAISMGFGGINNCVLMKKWNPD
jgi:3-oxoacyl-[acyl-carrier-protein] synthase II